MICPKCGKKIPIRDRYCGYCGASTGKGPRSAALKCATGLLFALTAYELLVPMAGILLTLRRDITVTDTVANPFADIVIFLVRFLLVLLCLSGAMYALQRKRWEDALVASILLPVVTIVGLFLQYGAALGTLFPPVDVVVVFFAQLVCIILISKAKADFS